MRRTGNIKRHLADTSYKQIAARIALAPRRYDQLLRESEVMEEVSKVLEPPAGGRT